LLIFLLLGVGNDRHSQNKDSLKHGSELQTAGLKHGGELQTAGLKHDGELQTAGLKHDGELQTAGLKHDGELQRVGLKHGGELQTAATSNVHNCVIPATWSRTNSLRNTLYFVSYSEKR
jgi:hypothetical protein